MCAAAPKSDHATRTSVRRQIDSFEQIKLGTLKHMLKRKVNGAHTLIGSLLDPRRRRY